MKVRIAIEQLIDVDEILSHNAGFELNVPADLADDYKINYLVDRFCEDIDSLVKYNEVREQVLVEYIED